MKRFFRRFSAVLLAALTASFTVCAAAGAEPLHLTEYDRLKIPAAPAAFTGGAQHRTVVDDGFSCFLTVAAEGQYAAYSPIGNLFTVYSVDRETEKKQELFSGRTLYGAGDLLSDGAGHLYVVGGGASWNYEGVSSPEYAVVGVWQYDFETGVATCTGSNRQFSFPVGSGYEYRTAAVDPEAGRIVAFFLSGDGSYLGWTVFDMAENAWVSAQACSTALAMDQIHAFAAGDGAICLAGQAKEDGGRFLLLRLADPDAPELTQRVETVENAGPLDLTEGGDVFWHDGTLHVLCSDRSTGDWFHRAFTADLVPTLTETLPLHGDYSLRAACTPEEVLLLAIPLDTPGFSLDIYAADSASLASLRMRESLPTEAASALKPGSFFLASSRSGREVLCLYAAPALTVGFLEAGGVD